jgi:hypothetical protein
MRSRKALLAVIAIVATICSSASAICGAEAGLTVWPVDPLVKVFRDTGPTATDEAIAEVARGEHATFQLVVRAAGPIEALRAEVAPLVSEANAHSTLRGAVVRFVGYVPVDRPIQQPPKDQLRKPPADFPDPLLEQATIDVPAGQSQPVWITLAVPAGAEAGVYRGEARLSGKVAGQERSATVPVAVRVFEVTVGKTRLWVTNWFTMQWQHMQIAPQPDSPEYWALLRRYARNMAAHRQNVALISPLGLARFTPKPDGTLAIDFSRFDRWVNIFTEEGVIGRIEGGHLGGRAKGWNSPFVVQIREVTGGKAAGRSVDPASPEADRFYAQFLPALRNHLREKGWLKQYLQHLADEPIKENIDSYQAIARLVRKYAPELRTIDAVHTKELAGAVDVWVPQLNYFHRDLPYYQERQRAGDEVWFYTCVFPQGEYANRFIEQPLLKTRLLHWINYRYGATGYLHWGYNHWRRESPFTHTTPAHPSPPYLPAGDAWIVYPGPDGPLASIRFEALRDGVVDHELLSMLGERDAAAAKRLVATHVLDFDRYDGHVKHFRATRRELLSLLARP